MFMFLQKIYNIIKSFIYFNKNYTSMYESLSHEIYRLQKKLDTNLMNKLVYKENSNSKIQIVFLLHNLNSWYSLIGLYDEFNSCDNVEVKILVAEKKDNTGYKCLDYLKKIKLEFIDVSNCDVDRIYSIFNSINPDVIFRQSPWDFDLPEVFSAVNLSSFKIIYIPYFALNLVELNSSGVNLQVNQNLHLLSWRIYCESKESFKEFKQSYWGDKDKIRYFGNIKLSYIHQKFQKNDSRNQSDKFRLLWAPHHSIFENWLAFSTFHKNYFEFLEFAQKYQDKVEIILRPHPLLFSNMYKYDANNFSKFLESWNELPNTFIDTEWDYIKSFEWSDLLITDGISFLAEYPLTGKNTIFLENSEHLPFNENGHICIECSYVAFDFHKAKKMILKAMKGELINKKLDRFISHLELKNGIAKLIVADILDSLG